MTRRVPRAVSAWLGFLHPVCKGVWGSGQGALLLCLSLGTPRWSFCLLRTLLDPTEVPSSPNRPECSAHPHAKERSACLGWPAHPAHVPDGQASAEPSGLGSCSVSLERACPAEALGPEQDAPPPRVLAWLLEQEAVGHLVGRGEEWAVWPVGHP